MNKSNYKYKEVKRPARAQKRYNYSEKDYRIIFGTVYRKYNNCIFQLISDDNGILHLLAI